MSPPDDCQTSATRNSKVSNRGVLNSSGGCGKLVDMEPDSTASIFRQSELLYRALIENAYDTILMLDVDGRVLYASPAVRNYGRDPAQIVGQFIWDEFHPDDLSIVRRNFSAIVGQPSNALEFEARVRDAAGHWRDKQTVMHNLLAHPAIRAVIANVRDITERKQAEERLSQQEAALAHVGRVSVMGEMAASLAHEISQPLHAIATFAVASQKALDADRPDSRAKAREWAVQIEEQVQRASEILHRIRQFVRRGAARRQPFDLEGAIREAVSLVEADFRRRRVRVDLDICQDLPPVLADRIQIEQVLVNLLRNSADAMDGKPESERRIAIRARLEPKGFVIAVTDAGDGIDEADLHRIFEPFYTTKPSGLGIGLAIGRRIVEDHGGALQATGNSPCGMTFSFTLPGPESGACSKTP